MLDLAFTLHGRTLPADHRDALAAAVEAVLPWLASEPGAGIHALKLAHAGGAGGSGGLALLSPRTRLVLRVPRTREDDARALEGRTLHVGGIELQIGPMQARELLPWGTLYAHLVATGRDNEGDFLRDMDDELHARGIQARTISGRHQVLPGGRLHGYSLMVDGLGAEPALALMRHGLGAHRRLGCGLFVPHKSAAAVGTPP